MANAKSINWSLCRDSKLKIYLTSKLSFYCYKFTSKHTITFQNYYKMSSSQYRVSGWVLNIYSATNCASNREFINNPVRISTNKTYPTSIFKLQQKRNIIQPMESPEIQETFIVQIKEQSRRPKNQKRKNKKEICLPKLWS